MKSQYFSKVALIGLTAAIANASNAAPVTNVKITGSIPTLVPIKQINKTATPTFIRIALEKVELSPQAKKYLASQAGMINKTLLNEQASSLPSHIDLGMKNVPVLNQGVHGTCATFASTAAIDAVYEKGSLVSQLCNLELGSFLEAKDSEYPSGWNGSMNGIVLDQIKNYGYITRDYQQQYGCGNKSGVVKKYPLNDEKNTGFPMSDVDFKKVSLSINDIYINSFFNSGNYTKTDMNKVLKKVKTSISKGHRVVFGTLLDVIGDLDKVNGAAGTYHVKNDTWIATAAVIKDAKNGLIDAGHAMVIIGYDDKAVITDSNGKKHKGLLTLRNSWSEDAGDNGNYYMSYEYFKLLVLEAVEVSPTPIN